MKRTTLEAPRTSAVNLSIPQLHDPPSASGPFDQSLRSDDVEIEEDAARQVRLPHAVIGLYYVLRSQASIRSVNSRSSHD